MTEQKRNIVHEIDMKTIIIHWKMRQWKTITAIHMALDEKYNWRIYSNVDIYHYGKSIITKKIVDFTELDRIRFSYTHWLIIIDEAWINANSKDSFWETNRLLQKILFLAWKKNCSVMWIAQRYDSIDINARVLADIIIKVKKIRRWKLHPTFILTRQRQKRLQLEFIQQYKLDVIWELKVIGITYDTLEESVMTNNIAQKRKKQEKEKLSKEKAKKRAEKKKKIKETKKKTAERKEKKKEESLSIK